MTHDRRDFLRSSGLAMAAALAGSCDSFGPRAAQGVLKRARAANEALERALQRGGSSGRAPAGAPLAGDALPAYFISNRMPVWDDAARGVWSLEVTGLVQRPRRFSLEELMTLRHVTQRVQHFCVEGWTATVEWTGTRLSEIARAVGVRPDAGYVDFESFDSGYHESWDLESAMHDETLVCYGKEGRMLAARWGAPARLHSPIKLGYKNVKYLTRIVFLPAHNGGYWSDRGYEWFAGT